MDTFFIIIIVWVVIGLTVNVLMRAFGKSKSEEDAEKLAIQEKNKQGVSNWLERRTKDFNDWRERLYSQHGEAGVCLQIKPNEPSCTLLIWPDKKIFYFNCRTLKFEDILGYEVSDNKRVVAGQTVATTKTDVWSGVQREAMIKSFGRTTGNFLSGPLKQNTTISQTPDMVYHSYNVKITVNNFNSPTLEINTGDNHVMADKVVSLINLMITNK